ncbi:MAG TPA: NAD(P)-dependent oxidoreductase [Acidimicrobiales bacterium]|nr:NAD(P)-dependent oxidoreductase [Acidimicrobiales bacterium]
MSTVFVAGATGVLGKRAVARLVAEGHDVTAVARSEEKAQLLSGLGATPVTVDLFDAAAVRDAVAGHEVVMNLATHIPPLSKAAGPGAWKENDRIRTEASRNLVDAALAARAQRYVQESIAFTYADGGDTWLDEDAPIDMVGFISSTSEAEGNAQRFTRDSAAWGGVGVVLRFGLFYGPDSHSTVDSFRLVRIGAAPVMGAATAYQSSISTDDAAAAAVAALRAPAGIYNVADDEPLTKREYADAVAAAAGAPRPVLVPRAAVKLGGQKVAPLARSHRLSNARFKQATGWAPVDRSAREGIARTAREMGVTPVETSTAVRTLLALLAISSLALGAWAVLGPHSFYDSFPGGRGWVAADGPFNEHLLRDFGGLNLALGFLLAVAAIVAGRTLARTAAVSALLFAVPHLVYHLSHLDVYDAADKVGNITSLSVAAVLPVAVLVMTRKRRGTGARSRHPEVAVAS